MKQIISDYVGKNGYVAINESIKEQILQITPETGAQQVFKEQALNIYQNSKSPLLDLTAFCANDELVNRNDAKINDVITFMQKEMAGGDLNFLVNLGKEEYFAKKYANGVNYDIKGDDVINDLKVLFNEPQSVIEEALKKGLFDSLESDIINDIKLFEFRNERVSKTRNKVKEGWTEWTELNESVSFEMDNQNLQVYNPIGIGVETGDEISLLIKDNLLRLSAEGVIPASVEEYEEMLVPEQKNLLNAINSVPYDIESNTYSLGGNGWDFDLSLSSTENGLKLIELRDRMNPDNVQKLTDDELQQFLFESVEQLYEADQSINKTALYHEADNFMLLNANFGRLIKLEDYIEIVNPENGAKVLIHKLEGENSAPQIINSNISGMQDFPTYKRMLTSIMEVLKPNDFQAETLMSYFQQRLNQDVVYATQAQTELETIKTKINDISVLITEAEKIKEIANPDSVIYKEKVAELNQLNAEYTELIKIQKSLNEKVAYYD